MATRPNVVTGILAGALLVALLILGALAGVLFTRPAQAQIAPAPAPRQVTVGGTGEVKGTPDTAQVQLGVETNAPTTKEALAQNNTQLEAIVAKLKELGIAEKDIQTSNFNISAMYDDQGRKVTGYTVTNMVTITIRQLDQAGALLDQVVQVGANRIYGISFSVNDPAALIAQARDKAFADARAKAEHLAKGSNATLGQVLIITENAGDRPVPLPAMARAELAQNAPAVPVQPGEQGFSTNVQVTFELR